MKIESRGTYEVHHPPNRLESKVMRTGGPGIDEIIAEATVGLARLAERYPDIVGRAIAFMRERLSALETHESPLENLKGLFKVAHDIKGQAATFGYPLLGDIAASMCQLMSEREDLMLRRIDLLTLYVDSMTWAMAQQLHDPSDPRARALLATMASAVAKDSETSEGE